MKQPYHHGSLRQALLDAAESILDRGGIESLTLRATAREAGVSHGAPAHHFGDLTGLLTELAASGFVRLRETAEAEAQHAEPSDYVRALGRGYVRFARSHPGIFLLMFRSERLDWSLPSLSAAGPAAFEVLSRQETGHLGGSANAFERLIAASARWSLMHGLATLIVDGRLGAMTEKVPDADLEVLVEKVLELGLPTFREG